MSDRRKHFLNSLFASRFWALFVKEVSQILHNRQLLIQLLVPPTVMLMLFGFALNPTFENLRVGITDYSQSRASRDFLELLNQTTAFVVKGYYADQKDMVHDLETGKLTVGLTIPPEFANNLARSRPAQVQALFDAVDANTANVASGYLSQLVSDYNLRRSETNQKEQGIGAIAPSPSPSGNDTTNSSSSPSTSSSSTTSDSTSQITNNLNSSTSTGLNSQSIPNTISPTPTDSTSQSTNNSSTSRTSSQQDISPNANPDLQTNQIELQTSVFYNPGLEASWFIVPGTIGIVLTVIGSQAAASLIVREKEAGTIEQLVMTPASNTEVILAKICPLLILLTIDDVIALTVSKIAFNLPLRGNLFLFLSISILYFFVGISIGIIVATYAKSEQQAQLTAFFINPPLVLLSGGNSPIAAMPPFMQTLSYLDPMRYFIEVCRGILLKGVGLESLWFQVCILMMFAIALMILSIRQFRRQLT
jgi:ABC-2 type transport system permease protein